MSAAEHTEQSCAVMFLTMGAVCAGLPERQLLGQLLPAESALRGGAAPDAGALRGHGAVQ